MTIEQVAAMTKPTITPAIAGAVIGCNPQVIRIMARTDPARLGFPVFVSGNRTIIPRLPFLAWLGYDKGKEAIHEQQQTVHRE
jgi:hypothetical protein